MGEVTLKVYLYFRNQAIKWQKTSQKTLKVNNPLLLTFNIIHSISELCINTFNFYLPFCTQLSIPLYYFFGNSFILLIMSETLDSITFTNLQKNADVINALREALHPMIELTLNEALKSIQQAFDIKFKQLFSTINVQQSDAAVWDKNIADLELENNGLNERVNNLEREFDEQSQYMRRDNLLFSGIPAKTAEIVAADAGHPTNKSSDSVVSSVISFCHANLDIDIERNYISVAYRLLLVFVDQTQQLASK